MKFQVSCKLIFVYLSNPVPLPDLYIDSFSYFRSFYCFWWHGYCVIISSIVFLANPRSCLERYRLAPIFEPFITLLVWNGELIFHSDLKEYGKWQGLVWNWGNRFQGLGGIPPPKALGVTPKTFQNADLFLWLRLPFVLIRPGLFENSLRFGGIWQCRLFVLVWTEAILKRCFSKTMTSS